MKRTLFILLALIGLSLSGCKKAPQQGSALTFDINDPVGCCINSIGCNPADILNQLKEQGITENKIDDDGGCFIYHAWNTNRSHYFWFYSVDGQVVKSEHRSATNSSVESHLDMVRTADSQLNHQALFNGWVHRRHLSTGEEEEQTCHSIDTYGIALQQYAGSDSYYWHGKATLENSEIIIWAIADAESGVDFQAANPTYRGYLH